MYYGTCGHGKGLVDAMSGFCVKIKGPLAEQSSPRISLAKVLQKLPVT